MSVCKNMITRHIEGKFHYDLVSQQITDYYTFPCGKCTNCKIQIAKEWALRCCLELPYWDKSIFTTLTFNDENNLDPSIHKEEFSKFIKDVRNDLRKDGRKIKVLGCGEYGDESKRKHYHAIIFGIGLDEETRQIGKSTTHLSENGILEENWLKGNVFNGVVTYNSARYVASYVFKKYYDDLENEMYTKLGLETPFQHTSGGIGKSYYEEYGKQTLQRGYIMLNGIKNTIPRYFLDLYEKDGYHDKLKTMQRDHAVDKFEKWYKSYTKKLSQKLCCQPDEFNYNVLADIDQNFRTEYFRQQTDEVNAKSNLADARNKLF